KLDRFLHNREKITALCSAGQMRTSVPTWFMVEFLRSAGELIASQLQPVKIAQDRHGNRFCVKEFIGQFGQLLDGYVLDPLDQFVETVEVVEVHLLPSQVRHASTGRFQRKHQASLQLIL